MYFVAKTVPSNNYVVDPKSWIFGIENCWERMVNFGINKKEKFVCFYSEEHSVLNDEGHPDPNYTPNWDELLWDEKIFPKHGCYYVNILYSVGK